MNGITVVTLREGTWSPIPFVIACHLKEMDQGQSCIPEIQRIMALKGWTSCTAWFDDYTFSIRKPHSIEWEHRVPFKLQPRRMGIKVTL